MKSDPTLLRLRAANPFADVRADDAALFARITGSSPDGSERRRRRYRPILVFALALVAVALLASTAFAISQWVVGDAVTPDVTRTEYRHAQHELTLPPGATWPGFHIDPTSVTGRGAGGGHAVAAAQNAWACYWVQAIHRHDTAAQTRAHAELNTLLDQNVIVAPADASENWTPPDPPNVPYAVFADDGGFQWLRETYAQAAAGHPQRLIDTCRANAPG
jgi:hypothetical protein